MILSNEGIKQALRDGAIEIDPVPEEDQYTTSAVDFTLGDDFRIWDEKSLNAAGAEVHVDLSKWSYFEIADGYLKQAERQRDGSIIFPPFHKHPWHVLVQTREEIWLKRDYRIAARVEGRSSLARIGLIVHLTAPIIHSGFRGNITLEMINFGPFYLKLIPGSPVCQLVFERLDSAAEGEPNTVFQGQKDPAGGQQEPRMR